MPFDVEYELSKWTKQKLSKAQNPEQVEELGEHLYEAWAYRVDGGMDEQQAWLAALEELGFSNELAAELLQVQELPAMDKIFLKAGRYAFFISFLMAGAFGGSQMIEGQIMSGLRHMLVYYAYYSALILGVVGLYAVSRQLRQHKGKMFSREFYQFIKSLKN